MKTKSFKTTVLILLGCAFAVASANAAILLDPLGADGDFDNGLGNWVDLTGTSAIFQTTTNTGRPATASDMRYRGDHRRDIGLDLGHTIASGESYDLSFYAFADDNGRWDLGSDTGQVVLYHTDDNAVGGTVTDSIILNTGLFSEVNGSFQFFSTTGQSFATDAGVGSKLFVKIEKPTTDQNDEIWSVDNISVAVAVPEPSAALLGAVAVLFLLRRRRD